MGVCGSYPRADLQAQQHQEAVSSAVHERPRGGGKRRRGHEVKILLLGAGESGKSTIVRQMQIIHLGGYSQSQLLLFRTSIYRSLIDSAQDVCHAMRKTGVICMKPGNRVHMQHILAYSVDSDPVFVISPNIILSIESMMQDPAIPRLMERSPEFYLMDSADYFFSHTRRIGAPNYVPSETDILRARVKTTGITESNFTLGPLSIRLMDVGGQRSERRKWIHCFEDVTCVIFCVAISEYDQVLLEENGQNRMTESLVLFESVVNSRWLKHTSIILFLNKIDVFKKKLAKSPLSKFFPEYKAGPDINKAAKFILWKFTRKNRAKLRIYPHLTQATDTSNIRVVFSAVTETIVTNSVRETGIL